MLGEFQRAQTERTRKQSTCHGFQGPAILHLSQVTIVA